MNFKSFKLQSEVLGHVADVLKAVGHPHRLRILEVLAAGEASVSDLQRTLDIPQAIVSQQLKIMRAGGAVTSRRQGTLALYRLANPGLSKLLKCLYSCQAYCLQTLPPSGQPKTRR